MKIDQEISLLQRKVIQSNNQYKQMFRKSKVLLQQNSFLLCRILKNKPNHSNLKSQRTVQKTSDQTQIFSKTAKRQKIQEFKTILNILKDMQTERQQTISQKSSLNQFDVGKYHNYHDKSSQKENIQYNRKQNAKVNKKSYVPLLMRMQIDIQRRKIKERQINNINIEKQQKEIQELKKIRQYKRQLIRQKSWRYLNKKNLQKSLSKNKSNTYRVQKY